MLAKVQKWGNSQGLRLVRKLLADARIEVGDEVDVVVKDGVIVVSPVRRLRGKHQLEELVARIPANYWPDETDWGKPVGGEAW